MRVQLIRLSQTYSLGKRTFSQESQVQTDKMVLDKVLSDDRTAAYVTSIDDINEWYLEWGNWYKSKQIILSEVRILMKIIIKCYLTCSKDPYFGWQMIKKFPFNEKLAMHMLHYQQARNLFERGGWGGSKPSVFYKTIYIYILFYSLGWLHHPIV